MADLVEFHEHEDSDEVHEGRVELEGDIGGADVVAARHDALHEEREAHGKVEAVLGGDTILLLVNTSVLHQEGTVLELLEQDDAHEEKTKHTVAEVTEHVVEVPDKPQRFPAEVVVVADVLVAGDALFVRE